MQTLIYVPVTGGSLTIECDEMGTPSLIVNAQSLGWSWQTEGPIKRYHGNAWKDTHRTIETLAREAAQVAGFKRPDAWAVRLADSGCDALWRHLAAATATGGVPAHLANSSATESVIAAIRYLAI